MFSLRWAVLVALLAAIVYYFYRRSSPTPQPSIAASGYYGAGEPHDDDSTIRPFQISVCDEDIADLKRRLSSTRIGHSRLEGVEGFEYGFALPTLLQFRDYWLHNYDWRLWESTLNSFPHYRTEIEGLAVHFIHAKAVARDEKTRVIPLLIVHGWPGNVFEFYKLIPLLTKGVGNIAFDVVAPSIPGFGWSDQPAKRGFNQLTTARVLNKLMVDRLGYGSYIAQGGDWGAIVASNIAKFYPHHLQGLHMNMMPMGGMGLLHMLHAVVGSFFPSWVFSSPAFANYSMTGSFWHMLEESGYLHIQATKPDTVGVALNDSPLGLMAYVLEKYSTWTNPAFRTLPDGGLERRFTKDELLTIVSIYWFQGNILSSQRYYKELFSNGTAFHATSSGYVSVPTGYAAFPHDLGPPQPIELCRYSYNLTHYTLFPDGGHFAAFEQPEWLADDLVKFAKSLLG